VEPSLVTDLDHAVLVPASGTSVASATITDFDFDGGALIVKQSSGTIVWQGNNIGKGTIMTQSPNGGVVIIKSAATGNFLLYNSGTGTPVNLSNALARASVSPKTVTSIAIDPYDATEIVLRSSDHIWTFDVARGVLTGLDHAVNPDRNLGPSIAISPSIIAWTRSSIASNTSALTLYDKSSKTTMVVSSTLATGNAKLKWIKDGVLGVLQNDGSLYIYDVNAGTLKDLADTVQEFEPTDDGSMIATIERNSMEIFSLTDASIYYRFNLPAVSTAQGIIWYKDENHLFLEYPDHISFLDLADSGLANFTTVADGTSPLYDPEANSLYLIDASSSLVRFDFPK